MTDFRTVSFTLAGVGVQTQVLMPNGRRRSVIFNLVDGANCFIATKQTTSPVDVVLNVLTNVPGVLLYRDHGELVTREWWAEGTGIGNTLVVTEVFIV